MSHEINRRSLLRPWFPPRDFPVTAFGAVGDGSTKNTAAFAAAIAACHRAGGGHVVVPSGTFLTGAIHLLSHVDLHVESGGTILFSQDPNDYLPVVFTRWQGIELMNYSPFVYSYGQRNIAVTGQGTLNGQADAGHWWNWKNLETADFDTLETMADDNVPVSQRVFGAGHYLPPQMVQPFGTDTVLLEGVTVINSPFWHLNPNLCENVTVDGLTITSSGPNTDGCDPESCDGVVVQNVSYDTGDDCMAIKSGRDADGRRVNAARRVRPEHQRLPGHRRNGRRAAAAHRRRLRRPDRRLPAGHQRHHAERLDGRHLRGTVVDRGCLRQRPGGHGDPGESR